MGNGHSVPPPPKAANKLSKPKTNSWGPLMSPKFRLRSRWSSQPKILRYGPDVEEAIASEGVGQEDTGGMQSRLLRPQSSHGHVSQMDIQSDVDGDYFNPADGLSMNNSQTVEVEENEPNSPLRGGASPKRLSAQTPRLSLQHHPYSSHKRSVSFVTETSPLPSSPKQLRSTGIGEEDKPRKSGPLQRAQSDTNLYAPIRRRSFLQHGIATRSGGMDTDPLRWFRRSSNSRGNVQNYRGNLASPTPNSLSNIPPIAPRLQVEPPGPRAETPSGSDYGHIGAFKLGSLRITNGAASPVPSDIPTTVCGDEEYVSASEGRGSLESDDRDTIHLGDADNQELVKDSWESSSQSTPRQASPDLGISTPEKQAVNATSPPKAVPVETHLGPQEFALFKFTDSPTRPSTPSNQYVQDDAMSPLSFENSPPISPSLQVQATSKHMAIEDDLFEPESQTPRDPIFRMHSSFDSGYQGLETPVAVKINPPQDLELKLLSKSDSGYSSNMSLRSCKSNPTVVSSTEGLRASSQAGISMPDRSTYFTVPTKLNKEGARFKEPRSRSTSIEGTISKASAVTYLTVRPKRVGPSSRKGTEASRVSSRPAPPVSFKYSPEIYQAAPSRSMSGTYPSQASRARPRTSSNCSSPGMIPNSNTTSRWRTKSSTRTRQPSQPIFTVQAAPSPSELLEVPPVPAETSRRFEQRAEKYPVISSPNAWAENSPTSNGASSDESRERVFSDGSMEFGDEVPCVPVNSPIQDEPGTPSTFSRRTASGVSAPPAGISMESINRSLLTSGEDTPGHRTKAYRSLGLQAYHNAPSHAEVQFERGRTVSREAPSLHSFERSVPRRYFSADFRPRCPSCGPAPQAQEWFGHDQRTYSMSSQYQNPYIFPVVNQKPPPKARRNRQKSLPPLPISMWTQDRMHASHVALHAVVPPVMTIPFPRPDDRLFNHGPVQQQLATDSRRNRKPFWASRRSTDPPRQSRSIRPSMEFHRPQPETLSHHLSFDMQSRDANYEPEAFESRPEIVGWNQERESYDNAFGNIQWDQQDPCDESHGTYYYSKKSKSPLFSPEEVGCRNNGEEPLNQQLPEAVHWRGTPTSNLLEPKGLAGDMADGYDTEAWNMHQPQPKRKRKGFRDSHAWGVAVNAVPVFLQKVKITKT